MPLDPGTKLAHYEIVSSLGAGGMGEVYRAEDTKLGREVAVELLLEEAPHLFLEIPAVQEIAISSDGATMAIGRRPIETMASEVRVVLNWFAELESLVPP